MGPRAGMDNLEKRKYLFYAGNRSTILRLITELRYPGFCVGCHYGMIWYVLTAIGLTPGGSGTVHIYTQTIHRTTH
jgi:hypothetical protein